MEKELQIRKADIADIPEIVSLLRVSLGESKLPKTEEIWRFKHVDNPFGPSLVLLAVLEGEIIGVRAFMSWHWNYNGKEYNVYRAVDTGVLPDHQGKGIFRKLNTGAVEVAQEKGNGFIFNTPNSKSLPGNLKMGWKQINKIRLNIFPQNPFHIVQRRKNINYKISKKASEADLRRLTVEYNETQKSSQRLFTPKSPEYLYWRYENNPLQKYEVLSDKDFYLSGYIKNHKRFIELRITEHIYVSKVGQEKIKNEIKAWNKKFKAPVVSCSPQLKISRIRVTANLGPILTLRNLNLESSRHNELLNLDKWEYTLGDLELF